MERRFALLQQDPDARARRVADRRTDRLVISGDTLSALIVGVLGEIIALLIDLHLTVTNELEDFKRADALRSALPARGPN